MTKVKICGITNLEDALLSVKFGADALGFNFYAKSPRYIEPLKAREIIASLPDDMLKVGVFVNETLERIIESADAAGLNTIQLHGDESPEFISEIKVKTGLAIIKAFRASPSFTPEDVLVYETDAILLDAFSPNEYGGTGDTFNWEIAGNLPSQRLAIYLAGGLTPDNVKEAIRAVRPYAVDVASGVESVKGKKDPKKIKAFIQNVRQLI